MDFLRRIIGQCLTFLENVRFLFLHKLEEPKPVEEPVQIPEAPVEPREEVGVRLDARKQDDKLAVVDSLAEDLQREDPVNYAAFLRRRSIERVPHFVRRVPGKHPDDKRDDA